MGVWDCDMGTEGPGTQGQAQGPGTRTQGPGPGTRDRDLGPWAQAPGRPYGPRPQGLEALGPIGPGPWPYGPRPLARGPGPWAQAPGRALWAQAH